MPRLSLTDDLSKLPGTIPDARYVFSWNQLYMTGHDDDQWFVFNIDAHVYKQVTKFCTIQELKKCSRIHICEGSRFRYVNYKIDHWVDIMIINFDVDKVKVYRKGIHTASAKYGQFLVCKNTIDSYIGFRNGIYIKYFIKNVNLYTNNIFMNYSDRKEIVQWSDITHIFSGPHFEIDVKHLLKPEMNKKIKDAMALLNHSMKVCSCSISDVTIVCTEE
jgi:hypothetical protein